jgi:hypothetical protein
MMNTEGQFHTRRGIVRVLLEIPPVAGGVIELWVSGMELSSNGMRLIRSPL